MKNPSGRPVLILDVGSSKVVGLLVEVQERDVRALSWAQVAPEGLKEGVVSNIQKAKEAIETCLIEVYQESDLRVQEVWVLVTARSIEGQPRSETVSVGQVSGTVGESHVRTVQARVRSGMPLPDNREILSVHINRYEVDGLVAENPIDMKGAHLTAHAYLIYIQKTVLENFGQVFRLLGYGTPRYEAQVVAASYGALDPDLMAQGVALVDIGKTITQVAVWQDGGLRFVRTLRLGSELLTQEIQADFHLPWHVAEHLKKEYGAASPEYVDNEMIRVPDRSGREIEISRLELADAIQAKLELMLRYIRGALVQEGLWGRLPQGLVFVGGGALLAFLEDFARERLRVPVQIGYPRKELQVPWEELRTPAYASTLGAMELLRREAELRMLSTYDSFSGWGGFRRKVRDFWESFWRKLMENF